MIFFHKAVLLVIIGPTIILNYFEPRVFTFYPQLQNTVEQPVLMVKLV